MQKKGPKLIIGLRPYPSFSLSGVGFVILNRAKPGARFDLLYQLDRPGEALTAGSPSYFRVLTYSEVRLLLAGASFTEGHALEFRGRWAVAGSSCTASYVARPQSLNRKLSQSTPYLAQVSDAFKSLTTPYAARRSPYMGNLSYIPIGICPEHRHEEGWSPLQRVRTPTR